MKLIAEPKDLTPVAKPINKSDNALKIRFTLNETARQNKQLHTTMRIMSEYRKHRCNSITGTAGLWSHEYLHEISANPKISIKASVHLDGLSNCIVH
jgi:hypothetical protein